MYLTSGISVDLCLVSAKSFLRLRNIGFRMQGLNSIMHFQCL